ncbi:MAG TPA: ABC transporter permease [Polyangiaceae bacterium]|nr:ABC transporter permease [Polyangiaceae bacterium]
MLADVRFALRLFARNPLFTAAIVLVLGLSVGASTTVFGLVDAYLLKPLPFREPDRLVAIWRMSRGRLGTNPFSGPDYLDVAEQAKSFAHIAALSSTGLNLAGAGDAPPEHVSGTVVTAGFFSIFGANAALGRTFTADEDRPGRDQVVVLSDALWRRRFNADPGVIGRTVTFDGEPHQIVGVMPASFAVPNNLWSSRRAEFWLPAALNRENAGARESHSWNVLGRLAPGASLAAADAELRGIARRLELAYPNSNADKVFYGISLQDHLASSIKPTLTILFAATLLLLFIASANVALLLLARATAREGEVGVRAALGASKPRLVRQFLVESTLLALLGGLAGFAFSFAGTSFTAAGFRDAAYAAHALRPDGRVLLFALLLASVAGLGFGLAPAFRASKARLYELLKEGAARSTSSGQRRRLQAALLVAEVALSAVLLAGSAAVARGFYQTLTQPMGFSTEGVLTFTLRLPHTRYKTTESVHAFHDGLLDKLRALPSVTSVGAANFIPLAGGNNDRLFSIEGRPPTVFSESPDAESQRVSGDYFQTLGIALRKGRLLTAADREGSAPVVVVDEALVQRYFAGEDPLGKRIKWWGEGQPWREIVGVVAPVRYDPWTPELRPTFYIPYAQEPNPLLGVTFVVKTGSSSPAALANAARQAVAQLDTELPIVELKTFDAVAGESVADRRFTLLLVSAFALSALVLTALGLFGLVSYQTRRRSRELAVRMALGAAAGDVVRLVLRDTSRLLVAGLLLGLPAAFLAGRLLAAKLEAVPPTDPLTLAATALVLGVVALAAVLAPARRAAKTPPALVLRDE